MIKTSSLLLLALFTLLVFPVIGYGIYWFFFDNTWFDQLLMPVASGWQIVWGIVYGLGTSLLAVAMLQLPFFQSEIIKYENLIGQLQLNWMSIIFISFCAGFGEELLFRASIQPWLGPITTSVLFVALHGYLNPKNWRLSIYGIYLTCVIIGIAYLYQFIGILCVSIAHMVIDIVLLGYLNRSYRQHHTNEEITI